MKSKLTQLLLIVVFTPLSLELVITGQTISLRDADDSRAFNHPNTIKAKIKDKKSPHILLRESKNYGPGKEQ